MDLYTAIIPLVGIIATFLSLTIILYTYFQNRTKERLALIAKDKDSSIWHKKGKGSSLKFAILMVSFGIGATIGLTFERTGLINEEIAVLGFIPIFVGMGLVVHHYLVKDKDDYYDDQV